MRTCIPRHGRRDDGHRRITILARGAPRLVRGLDAAREQVVGHRLRAARGRHGRGLERVHDPQRQRTARRHARLRDRDPERGVSEIEALGERLEEGRVVCADRRDRAGG